MLIHEAFSHQLFYWLELHLCGAELVFCCTQVHIDF